MVWFFKILKSKIIHLKITNMHSNVFKLSTLLILIILSAVECSCPRSKIRNKRENSCNKANYGCHRDDHQNQCERNMNLNPYEDHYESFEPYNDYDIHNDDFYGNDWNEYVPNEPYHEGPNDQPWTNTYTENPPPFPEETYDFPYYNQYESADNLNRDSCQPVFENQYSHDPDSGWCSDNIERDNWYSPGCNTNQDPYQYNPNYFENSHRNQNSGKRR